ncbi:VOC family protein [Streptomyces sp. NPDC048479]|uniref:VOC family protein n=1 Tax=Streptomyces sp. NPDC048479 TaxID=3154725 RepID=UPI003434F226
MDKETRAAKSAAAATSSAAAFGAPCWVSLMARDLEAAQDFYGAVLGWRFRKGRLGDQFSVAFHQSTPVAGIGALAPQLQIAVAWTPYFAVTDTDEAAARIRERSGTVAVGPLTFSLGRGALASDRDGAVFGIWDGELIPDWHSWRKRTPTWLRLRTRNAFEAAIFYGEVLEWACERPGSCEVSYEENEVVLHSDGHVLARLSSGAEDAVPDPMIQPRWHIHFPVKDVDATADAAVKNGGFVLVRRSTPHGPETTLCDADGALFTVTSRQFLE